MGGLPAARGLPPPHTSLRPGYRAASNWRACANQGPGSQTRAGRRVLAASPAGPPNSGGTCSGAVSPELENHPACAVTQSRQPRPSCSRWTPRQTAAAGRQSFAARSGPPPRRGPAGGRISGGKPVREGTGMSLNGAQGWPGGQGRRAAPSQSPHLLAYPPDRPARNVGGIQRGHARRHAVVAQAGTARHCRSTCNVPESIRMPTWVAGAGLGPARESAALRRVNPRQKRRAIRGPEIKPLPFLLYTDTMS